MWLQLTIFKLQRTKRYLRLSFTVFNVSMFFLLFFFKGNILLMIGGQVWYQKTISGFYIAMGKYTDRYENVN